MVSYNFQKQFADDVEYGIKTQTIRQKERAKKGDRLQLYTGMRTKSCRKLTDAICTDVKPIMIDAMGITISGRRLLAGSAYRDEAEDRDNDFAKKDGFEGFSELAEWFSNRYGLPFHGFITYWRPLP